MIYQIVKADLVQLDKGNSIMKTPILKPNDKNSAVIPMKEHLVARLHVAGNHTAASKIDTTNSTYGVSAVSGIKILQKERKLPIDGIIGEKTWIALGFAWNPNDSPNAGKKLSGIPWVPGVVEVDGHWVYTGLASRILKLRAEKKWTGTVTSGYRPDWYQRVLFDAAVKKYGSYGAASKWVAPPGTSHHRYADRRGAVDMTNASQVFKAGVNIYQAMSWENWHGELRSGYSTIFDPTSREEDLEENLITDQISPSAEDLALVVSDADDLLESYLSSMKVVDLDSPTEETPVD